jgi:arylsulfatase B
MKNKMLLLFVQALLLVSLSALANAAKAKKPHLILIVADDYGWANIGFHRTDDTKEVQTPNLDALAQSGVIFDRFYAYKICSPSRSSLQSGRNAVHVNTVNTAPEVFNPSDRISGYAGIPRNMTCIAEKLRNEGYRTVMSGKWDAGMATYRHTPLGRGYDSFLGYFHHANDYYTCGLPLTATGEFSHCDSSFADLWKDNGPALNLPGTAYEEDLFTDHSIKAIQDHDSTKPLFLFHSFHLIHTPLQVPHDVEGQFSFIDNKFRRKYAAMVYYMDVAVGRLVDSLKSKKMFDDSLILFFSDNGGAIYIPGSGNNWPLRGGKYADFE